MPKMLMDARTRANGKHHQGPGGRRCVCCDDPPRDTPRVRRSVKRSERNAWKRAL